VSTPAGCTLTLEGLSAQRARIAAIRPAVRRVERSAGEVRISVDSRVDASALADWIGTERDCCSFLTIEYGPDRLLRIASDDPARRDVLDGFATVFGGAAA